MINIGPYTALIHPDTGDEAPVVVVGLVRDGVSLLAIVVLRSGAVRLIDVTKVLIRDQATTIVTPGKAG